MILFLERDNITRFTARDVEASCTRWHGPSGQCADQGERPATLLDKKETIMNIKEVTPNSD